MSCPHRPHASRADARRSAQAYAIPGRIVKCRVCGYYHIRSTTKRQQRHARKRIRLESEITDPVERKLAVEFAILRRSKLL